MKNQKTVDCYGVKVSTRIDMQIMKYLENHNIAMNTISKEQRTKLIKELIPKLKLRNT